MTSAMGRSSLRKSLMICRCIVHGFLDAFEVARKLADEVEQVGVAVEHLVIGHRGDFAASRDAVAFGGQLCDLRIEPVNARLPVRVRLGAKRRTTSRMVLMRDSLIRARSRVRDGTRSSASSACEVRL